MTPIGPGEAVNMISWQLVWGWGSSQSWHHINIASDHDQALHQWPHQQRLQVGDLSKDNLSWWKQWHLNFPITKHYQSNHNPSSFEWIRGEESLSMSFHYQSYINVHFIKVAGFYKYHSYFHLSREYKHFLFHKCSSSSRRKSRTPDVELAQISVSSSRNNSPHNRNSSASRWEAATALKFLVYLIYNINWSPKKLVSFQLSPFLLFTWPFWKRA